VKLIEAARQAAVMLWSQAHGWPVDVKLTFNSMTAELPAEVDREVPPRTALVARPVSGTHIKRCRRRTSLVILLLATAEPMGTSRSWT
jgi:hypothetical protein